MDFQTLKTESARINESNDCGVKAMAVACEVEYDIAHLALSYAGRRHRCGTIRQMYFSAAKELNCRLIDVSSQFKSRTLRTFAREVDNQNYLVRTTRHASGVAKGKVIDWADGKCKRILEIFRVERLE